MSDGAAQLAETAPPVAPPEPPAPAPLEAPPAVPAVTPEPPPAASSEPAPRRRRSGTRESSEARRRRYADTKLKAAKTPAEKDAVRAKYADVFGSEAAAADAAGKPGAQDVQNGAAADPELKPWEDPGRRGWPRRELIDAYKPHVDEFAQLLAPAFQGTPYYFGPRTYVAANGEQQTINPLPSLVENVSAILAKWLPPSDKPATPERALIGDLVKIYGLPILMTQVFGAAEKAQNARERAANAELRVIRGETVRHGDVPPAGVAS